MATLITSTDVHLSNSIDFDIENIEFLGGQNIGGIPTLYDYQGHYVESVNQWFIHLASARQLEDLSSYSRALLRYWKFLELNRDLAWDNFPPIKSLKPTYRFRNEDLLRSVKEGKLAYSTANVYIHHVVQFYLWAAEEHYYSISENHKPFEIEFVNMRTDSTLAILMPKFSVQTSDLRIRVPKNSSSGQIRSLNPLSQKDLFEMSRILQQSALEIYLICNLGLQCGLRIGEASGLTVSALNQAVATSNYNNRYQISIGPHNGVPTKFSKTRTIEMPSNLLNALCNYAIDERRLLRLNKLHTTIKNQNESSTKKNTSLIKLSTLEKEQKNKKVAVENNEPLFISQRGIPFSPTTIYTQWGKLRSSIQKTSPNFNFKFHDLRCSYGTYRLNDLLHAGLEPAEALDLLMGWMGHNHESTTWQYLRYLKYKDALKDKIAMLDSIMHEALNYE
ncbi:TPA: tyrosine-type recombinase/integrase [Yersinia enterocolitica]|nr:site-specific integrase [Yersinia enterocolitica]HDL6638051.1 site-specific integrase [Yersinia enterocolitica]HDL6660569.1 site-specific integrase [Yersinia enterocolitica]HDL6664057.1 site-specific integrase [Yersinia enterocolitica]HDL6712395.1 site-specific integrase [Yersinia enterocolitica]